MVIDLLKVAEGLSITYDVIKIFGAPMSTLPVEEGERDKVCHKTRGKCDI